MVSLLSKDAKSIKGIMTIPPIKNAYLGPINERCVASP